jgi:hypothetical protein
MLKKFVLAAALILFCALAGFPRQGVLAQISNPAADPAPTTTSKVDLKSGKVKESKSVKFVPKNDLGIIEGTQNANLYYSVNETVKSAAVALTINSTFGEPVGVSTTADGSTYIKREGGAFQAVGSTMAFLLDSPAAGTQPALADAASSLGIVTPAYAQGVGLGFASLSPILEMWKLFRNIAYFFFVLVILAIGFMIMFRQKIGQTAVTAQQAIPNVIVALITVSFSYAIAGFMIDIMYLIMFFFVGVFNVDQSLISDGIITLGLKSIGEQFTDTWNAFDNLICSTLPVSCNIGTTDAAAQANDALGFSSIGGLTIAVIISVAILISIFRLFFEMIKTYITIVLSIVTAPLLLMLNAIPGRNTFGKWVQNLIGNLAAFPIVLLIFTMFGKIQEISFQEGGFNPPYVFYSANPQAIVSILGVGMLMIITDLVIQGKKAMGATGGIFEQFAGNFIDSFKKGASGDANLIPGLGFTNLARSPLVERFGGLGGANIARKGIVGATSLATGALAGIPGQGIRDIYTEVGQDRAFARGAALKNTAKTLGGILGDKQWNNDKKKP